MIWQNGFWFSLGWCVAFLIPSAILAMKLAKFYRVMSEGSDKEEWVMTLLFRYKFTTGWYMSLYTLNQLTTVYLYWYKFISIYFFEMLMENCKKLIKDQPRVYEFRGVAKGRQWGTYFPRRGFQKFYKKEKTNSF